jgi:hypothetical protein
MITSRSGRPVSRRATRRFTPRSRFGAGRALAVAALACLTAGCGGAAARTGAATWPSPHASATATATATGRPTTAGVPTFAATPTAQVRVALTAWMDAVGNPDTEAMSAASGPVAADMQRLDFVRLQQDCTGLAQVVATLQGHRPVPDAAAENHWSKALKDLRMAATTCVAAAGRQDMTGLARTSSALQASDVELKAFSARLSQFDS